MDYLKKITNLTTEYMTTCREINMVANHISYVTKYGQYENIVESLTTDESIHIDELEEFVKNCKKRLGKQGGYISLSHDINTVPYDGDEFNEYRLECRVDTSMTEEMIEEEVKKLTIKKRELNARKYEIEQIFAAMDEVM